MLKWWGIHKVSDGRLQTCWVTAALKILRDGDETMVRQCSFDILLLGGGGGGSSVCYSVVGESEG